MINNSSIIKFKQATIFKNSIHQGDPLVSIEGFKLYGALLLKIHLFSFKPLPNPRSIQDWCWRSNAIYLRHFTFMSTCIWSIWNMDSRIQILYMNFYIQIRWIVLITLFIHVVVSIICQGLFHGRVWLNKTPIQTIKNIFLVGTSVK